MGAVVALGRVDPRLRVVIHDRAGPTTKADCLNRLYQAVCRDEERGAFRYAGVILHDSEDMVHPFELSLIDCALQSHDFVQLPVRPELPPGSHWVSGHYCDEFTESHAKTMVVRDAMGAGLPAAGVCCGFGRSMLDTIRDLRLADGESGPFASECFTEDYELGLLIARVGGRSRFLRLRDAEGQLIGVRSYFPANLEDSVRQKTRWMHGIALQSWDRLGWGGKWVDVWMALRDRRGPLTALVLSAAYSLVLIAGIVGLLRAAGLPMPPAEPGYSPLVRVAMLLTAFGLFWRTGWRLVFTAREYGFAEGLRSVARIPVANIITILAGRRAIHAYARTLLGRSVAWDKTEHSIHPAQVLRQVMGRA